jgi:tetratricopeptide (TPR) repeat protein
MRKDFPGVPEDPEALAHLHHWWGAFLLDTDRLKEAEKELRITLALREKLDTAEPGNPESKASLAHIQDYMGQVLTRKGSHAQAEDLFRQAVDNYERLVEDFPDISEYRRRLSLVLAFRSRPLRALGYVREAEDSLLRSLEQSQKLNAVRPAQPGQSGPIASIFVALGDLYRESGKLTEADESYRRAVDGFEKAVAEITRISWMRVEYAWLLSNCPATRFRDPERAIALTTKALELAPMSQEAWQALGVAHYRAGHWKASLEALNESSRLRVEGSASEAFFLARVHWRLGEKDEARRWYDKGIRWAKESEPAWFEDLVSDQSETEALLGRRGPEAQHGRPK